MANPIARLIALAKSGDRRVLLGGAAIIGGGIGLIVFLSSRGSSGVGAGLGSLVPNLSDAAGGGGGGGGGSSSDLSEVFSGQDESALSLPELTPLSGGAGTLGDVSYLNDTGLYDTTEQPNLGGSEPLAMPALADYISAAPMFGGAMPDFSLPELPMSYAGATYGNDIGGAPNLPTVSGVFGQNFREPAPAQQPQSLVQQPGLVDAPVAHSQALNVRRTTTSTPRLSSAESVDLVLAATPPTRQISQADQSALSRLANALMPKPPAPKPPVSNLSIYQPTIRAPGGGVVLRGTGESESSYITRATQYVQQLAARQQQIPRQVVQDLAGTASRQISAGDAAGLSRLASGFAGQGPIVFPQGQTPTRPISTQDAAGLSRLAAALPAQPATNLVIKPNNRIDDLR